MCASIEGLDVFVAKVATGFYRNPEACDVEAEGASRRLGSAVKKPPKSLRAFKLSFVRKTWLRG
jgi:hypothetical protein